MADLIQIRRDTRANWASANPKLAIGEVGIITDNNTPGNTGSLSFKVGDGTNLWNQMPEQVLIGPDTLENISASIAAVQTGSAADLVEVSQSLNNRITSVSSSLSSSIVSVDSRLTTVSGSLDTRINSVSSSLDTRINSVSSSLDTKINNVSSSLDTTISSSSAEINDRIDGVEQDIQDNYARQDGYYSTLTAGAAETLVGQTVDSEAYLIRPTGGAENEVANGVASVLGMEGNSAVWNQLIVKRSKNETTQYGITFAVNDGYFSFNGTATQTAYIDYGIILLNSKLVPGHKVYVNFYGLNTPHVGMYFGNGQYFPQFNTSNKIQTVPDYAGVLSINLTFKVIGGTAYSGGFYYQLFDLTLLGIDNLTTTDQVEAWLAQHVGTKPYYAYNKGTILSAQTLGIKTYGQNLLNPTTRQAKLIPYTWEENSNVYTIKNVPSGATATFTPDATGVAESITITNNKFDITNYGSGILELSAATANTYVCMKWDEQKDDDVVPYEDHTYDFDVRKVYGKVNGEGEYAQCFPDGMRSAGSVHDILTASEVVVKIGNVNLGNLTWVKDGTRFYTRGLTSSMKRPAQAEDAFIGICDIYEVAPYTAAASKDKVVYTSWKSSPFNAVWVKASDYSTYTADTFKTAMNGVMLNYELATPVTYTDLIYRDGGIDRPLTDVLFNIEVNNWSIEEQLLTPYVDGNPTAVPAKISIQYGMDAVEEIDTIKHTYVSAYNEQSFNEAQKAQARRNIGAVEENGTYPNMVVGSAKNLAGENAVEAEYTYRTSGGSADIGTGAATIDVMKGKTLKLNQLIVLISETTSSNSTITLPAFSRTKDHLYYLSVLVKSEYSGDVSLSWYGAGIANSTISLSSMYQKTRGLYRNTAEDSTGNWFRLLNPSTVEVKYKWAQVIDLTLMFGAGNEPSTVAEFEALYPLDYYDYTATPVLINNAASGIVTTGFNQWDEEWEANKTIDTSSGEIKTYNGNSVSKNFISVFPNTNYCYTNGSWANKRIGFYDAEQNFISVLQSSGNGIFTTPSDCHYIKFYWLGTTYNHDICINLSWSGYRNGEYEPYEKHTLYFDTINQAAGGLNTVKGRLLVNGEPTGESVTIFPDGWKSAGSVYDFGKADSDGYIRKVTKRIGSVDLGSLTWSKEVSNPNYPERNAYKGAVQGIFIPSSQSQRRDGIVSIKFRVPDGTGSVDLSYGGNSLGIDNTMATAIGQIFIRCDQYNYPDSFKTAMSGIMLYYKLATPEEYLLDTPIPATYLVNDFGTEARIPTDTSSSLMAPISYEVKYAMNATDTIRRLPINYIGAGSMENFTTELASKLGTFLSASIAVSSSYDATNQEYDYSITVTPNA